MVARCNLLRREVLLSLLVLLVLTAPASWPVYSACAILANVVVATPAHIAFRQYQMQEDTGRPTVVTTLMHFLSHLLQIGGTDASLILILKLLIPETSLQWYQNHPDLACLLVFPRYEFVKTSLIKCKDIVHHSNNLD
jgi:hypothetical protein